MNFNEKLQKIRKSKGITQEELAEHLFVSRTAVSKWESGKGYPNIDSLKAIANFFGITIDELLSSDQLLTITEENEKQSKAHIYDLVFGLLDISSILLLFLPFFRQSANDSVQSVSLVSLSGVAQYLKVLYFILTVALAIFGIIILAMQNANNALWLRIKRKTSLLLCSLALLLFALSLQPYATVFLFIITATKGIMLIKWR